MATSGTELRCLRLARGLTLSNVATACGITKAAVAHWESGLRIPTQKHCDILKGLYGATVESDSQHGLALWKLKPRPKAPLKPKAVYPLPANPTFGDQLRHYRTKANMTQPEVAAYCSMSASTICCLESGKRAPTPTLVKQLQRLFMEAFSS